VSTIAGSGKDDYADGNGANAAFNEPRGVCADLNQNIIVADTKNHRIRRISPNGDVTTVAGTGHEGYAEGKGTEAAFSFPDNICVDKKNNIIVADTLNHRIRKITPEGDVTTIAGTGKDTFADGEALLASFNKPRGICVDDEGNFIVADDGNNRIRKITTNGTVITIAGSAKRGAQDGDGIKAEFNHPTGVCIDKNGNIIIADFFNLSIRFISPNGYVGTIAGKEAKHVLKATLTGPCGVCVDDKNNVIIADFNNNRIRKIQWKDPVYNTGKASLAALGDGKISKSNSKSTSATQDSKVKTSDNNPAQVQVQQTKESKQKAIAQVQAQVQAQSQMIAQLETQIKSGNIETLAPTNFNTSYEKNTTDSSPNSSNSSNSSNSLYWFGPALFAIVVIAAIYLKRR